jgi:transposase-like protein
MRSGLCTSPSNDEAVFKLLYLSLTRREKTWARATRDWGSVLDQFAILFKGRLPAV